MPVIFERDCLQFFYVVCPYGDRFIKHVKRLNIYAWFLCNLFFRFLPTSQEQVETMKIARTFFKPQFSLTTC